MVATLSHTPLRAPPFIRLLSRLAQSDAPPPGPALSDRLSRWTDWSRAVALSRALDGMPPAAEPAPPSAFEDTEQAACTLARAKLMQAIDADDDAGSGGDYTPFQQRYVSLQRAMLAATGRLRGRLRDALARQSTDMARLAEVDAVMERLLSPREQTLLASVPVALGQHFMRLRQAANGQALSSDAWLDTFRRDMRALLLAELELRFQPLEGLLAALRGHPQECHVQKYA